MFFVQAVWFDGRIAFRQCPGVCERSKIQYRLSPYAQLPYVARNMKTFETLVNVAFQQRRKTLRNSLKSLLTSEQLDILPVDLNLRPENISVGDYVRISNLLGELNPAPHHNAQDLMD